MRSNALHRVGRLLMLAVLAAPSAAGCQQQEARAKEPAPPAGSAWLTPQQVADARLVVNAVSKLTVGAEIATSGRLTFHDLKVAHVFSPVTGRVQEIDAEPGKRVKKGDTLAVIESPDVGNAFSELEKAQADALAAESEYRRQKELYEAHAGPRKDFEAADASFRKATAELDRAREKARLLHAGGTRGTSQKFVLRSPIDGEVVARNLSPGGEVQGQYGGGNAVELFTIGDLDPIVLLADVFEMDLARVARGARVTIAVPAYPGKTYEGVVDWISEALDPVSRTAKVRCVFANPRRELKAEMYATVTIAAQGVLALAIPRDAVLRIADQSFVFVERGKAPDGRAQFERRLVAVDEELAGRVNVPLKAGLAEGERIVTSGAILLSAMVQ